MIVPGDRTVAARCDSCWRYGNPREFAEIRLGGRKNALLWDVRRACWGEAMTLSRPTVGTFCKRGFPKLRPSETP